MAASLWPAPPAGGNSPPRQAAARLRSGLPLTPGQALLVLGLHFQDTWEAQVSLLLKDVNPILKRDRGRCQVPACSHRAEHVHHVRFRSHGGPTIGWNLISVCAAHHLAGIHQGYITVTGTAPDGLVWEFPARAGPDEAGQAARPGEEAAA